ncbi:threonine-phosphate decarboxylase CobD [Woodsholea maritima]|uniref:threonine-phosphate decarboxylase CobD n=1 Tax=Woodsholea maritima TaxID=240237 RepID=UPI00037D4A48|nr:threonine-phosphate decarboxylase CobD [Woodsholea maritima]
MRIDLRHGGLLDAMKRDFAHAPQPWLDLSTGINPWPYALGPLHPDSLTHLPTETAKAQCLGAMAQAWQAKATSITLIPGSELIIRLLPNLIAPRRVALTRPMYSDHERIWRRAGVEIVIADDPLDAVDDVDLVVICNPNNPDGRAWSREDLRAARVRLAKRGGFLLLDEAYGDLDEGRSLCPEAGAQGLLILRSTGKFYGLAGLRLGAFLAPPAIQAALEAYLGFWSVSGPALEAGARLYQDLDWQAQMRRRLAETCSMMDAALESVGIKAVTGSDLFRYLTLDKAHAVWQHLAEAGIYTRRFNGDDHHLRLGLCAGADLDRLVQALADRPA